MAGDMLKSVYDTDDDGVVDTAETIAWSGVTGAPAFDDAQYVLSAQVFN
jgi:hypothetical protein